MRKIAVIGCGFVGSSCAFTLMQSNLFSEMVLIDVDKDRAEGEAMDMSHGLPFETPMKIYAGEYEDIADCAIVIITAGANQKPDETRLDLVAKNVGIYKHIIPELVRVGCEGILLIVSNPVDILTYTALKLSGFPENRVIGSGTVLDTARLKYLLGEHLKIDNRGVHAFIIGEHGDSEFVPWSNAFVSTKSTDELCAEHPLRFSKDKLTELEQEVRGSAYKIIAAKQATCYGIGMALARITKAIFEDEHSILTVSSLLEGEYNLGNVWLGTPCILGKEGIYGKLRLNLTDEETEKLKFSANVVAKNYDDALSSIII